jgi:hypothetical protein
MSTKRNVAGKVLAPLLAAGTSVAASYLVKKGPEFVENTMLPWLRETAQGVGGAAERLPDKARSAVSSGGDLAEQLTDQARDVTGLGGGASSAAGPSSRSSLSQDELSRRSDDRAKRRAQRRKATKRK